MRPPRRDQRERRATHASDPPHTLATARIAGPACRPVHPFRPQHSTASRRASPSYPLLVLQVECIADHVVLDELAYRADGHLVGYEQELLIRKVHAAL